MFLGEWHVNRASLLLHTLHRTCSCWVILHKLFILFLLVSITVLTFLLSPSFPSSPPLPSPPLLSSSPLPSYLAFLEHTWSVAGLVLEKPIEVLPVLDTTLVDVQRKVLEETAVQAQEGGGGGEGTWVCS